MVRIVSLSFILSLNFYTGIFVGRKYKNHTKHHRSKDAPVCPQDEGAANTVQATEYPCQCTTNNGEFVEQCTECNKYCNRKDDDRAVCSKGRRASVWRIPSDESEKLPDDEVKNTESPWLDAHHPDYPKGECECVNALPEDKYTISTYHMWNNASGTGDPGVDSKNAWLDKGYGRKEGVANYGEFCSDFDKTTKSCEVISEDTNWCLKKWCYVRPVMKKLDMRKTFREQQFMAFFDEVVAGFFSSATHRDEHLDMRAYCTNMNDIAISGGETDDFNGTDFTAGGAVDTLKFGKLFYSYGYCLNSDEVMGGGNGTEVDDAVGGEEATGAPDDGGGDPATEAASANVASGGNVTEENGSGGNATDDASNSGTGSGVVSTGGEVTTEAGGDAATTGDGDAATTGDGDAATTGDSDAATTGGGGDAATTGDGDAATTGGGDSAKTGGGDAAKTGGGGDAATTGGGDAAKTGGGGDAAKTEAADGTASTEGVSEETTTTAAATTEDSESNKNEEDTDSEVQ